MSYSQKMNDLAYEIQNSNYISKGAVEVYSQHTKTSKKFITKILKNNDIILTDNKYSFNIHNVELFNKNLKSIVNDLDNRVMPRGVYAGESI